MNKKKNWLKASLLGFALLGGSLSYGVIAANPAGALECSILPESVCKNAGEKPKDETAKSEKQKAAEIGNSGVMQLLKLILRILTAGVGIVATGALVYAGILYASASDNASQISQAKTIITNVVIGIVAYGLMVLVVNFLIPGGVFG